MPIEQDDTKNIRSALEFLIESNLRSKEGIIDVPQEFIDRNLKLVELLKLKTKSEIADIDLKTFLQGSYEKGTRVTPIKKWTHKSVVKLMQESDYDDPIDEIKKRSRQTVLFALSKGWSGPPFDAIKLAKILGYDISPNDAITDARTIAIGKSKFRIEYNPFQKPTRLNFSIGHEIVHTFFSDCHEQIRNREEDSNLNRQLEQLCNIGASELQLPYVIFPADANAIESITIEKVIEQAQKYKSSLESYLLAFAEAIDRPVGIMICTFWSDTSLELDYSKTSSSFDLSIPADFVIPRDSRAYYCNSPGSSQRETIQWSFMDGFYDIFCIGISPMRKEKKPRVAIILVPNESEEKLQNKRIQIEFGDATKPKGKGIKIIAQVVNTSAALGIGFGKSLSMNYPKVKDALKKWKEKKADFRLGKSQLIQVKEDIYVFQMLAQNGLRGKEGKTLLDYQALTLCLGELRDRAKELHAEVYMPLIGSGQARGKWEIIEGLVYSELVNKDVKVTIYLFGSRKPDEFRPTSTLSLFNEKSTWEKEK